MTTDRGGGPRSTVGVCDKLCKGEGGRRVSSRTGLPVLRTVQDGEGRKPSRHGTNGTVGSGVPFHRPSGRGLPW